ncbi:hypothetical protein NP493_315g01026 [Ridgeia piscesae]|uniref:UDP-N-acetylglucosamine transferase subunit ALG14 n=1 Tax=Ridgeia piscesae TaxID=27915 RepID=A0AAD9L4R1_RIDPI|nr:hypothetical protein NP493_315g01026 [Ridgeia piscesae]
MDGVDVFDILFLSILAIVFGVAYIITRLILVLLDIHRKRKTLSYGKNKRKSSIKTMIVVGSGGHTTEMLRLLEHVSNTYSPRFYIMADTDKMSEEKITKFEKQEPQGKYLICKIPRSREVKQSYLSTVISTIYSLLKCVPLVFSIRPDLFEQVLCNGPGTCIPVCLLAFLLRVVGIKQTTVIFVESVCRVKTLSLSGRLLYYFADHVLVQWPALQNTYPLAAYVGRLV